MLVYFCIGVSVKRSKAQKDKKRSKLELLRINKNALYLLIVVIFYEVDSCASYERLVFYCAEFICMPFESP